MDFDPDARRLAPIEVELGGVWRTIPPVPAAAWIRALRSSWAGVILELLDDGALDDEVCEGHISTDELTAAARDALTVAAGVRWSVAYHLIAFGERPETGGELILRGLDTGQVSLGAYVLVCYNLATRHRDAKGKAEIDMALQQPPAGTDPEEWFDEDEAAESFLAAMGAQAG